MCIPNKVKRECVHFCVYLVAAPIWVGAFFDGLELSERLNLMTVGMADPVLGGPVMDSLRASIKGCPEPMRIEEAGHFVQEWGEAVAEAALAAFS